MKKILAILLASLSVLGLFAGCGTVKPEGEAEGLKVAAIETAYGSEVWQQVCEAFTAETGIKVTLTTSKTLEDEISAPMQNGEFPDVIHLATGRPAGLTEQFIKDKNLHDLSGVLATVIPGETETVANKIEGGFLDTTLTNPYGDGKTYMAPMFYSPCGLFYNARLFEKMRWEVPTTWDEMWILGDKALEEGIYLFTYPTAGYYDAFMYALIYSIGGAEFFNAVTTYEEGVWDTKEARTLTKILDKLAKYTHPKTPAQANNQDFTKNQLMVIQDEALFMPNGTWVTGEMAMATQSISDGSFAWGMTALPAAYEGGAGYSYCWIEQAWIPEDAENKEDAEKFVAFLYSDKAAKIFAAKGAVQPIKGVSNLVDASSKMFYSIYDNGAKSCMGNFAAFSNIPGVTVSSVFFEPIDQLVAGSITIDQYVANIKAVNDQMRANLIG